MKPIIGLGPGSRVMVVEHADHVLPEVLKDIAPIEGHVVGPLPSDREDLNLWKVTVPDIATVIVAEEQLTDAELRDFLVSYLSADGTAASARLMASSAGAAVETMMLRIKDLVEDGEPIVFCANAAKKGQTVRDAPVLWPPSLGDPHA